MGSNCRGSKFRFSIDIAQTPTTPTNFHELNILGIAQYHEKHENIPLYGSNQMNIEILYLFQH